MAIINGTNGNNTLVGTIFIDTINGFGGNDILEGGDSRDTLNGGSGNDTFRYNSVSHLDAGEIVNGGTGSDKLRLNNGGSYDFRLATLTSIEEVEFGGGDNTDAQFNSSQIGAGLSSTAVIDGFNGAGINDYLRVHMNTATVDLSNLVFQDWVEADDHVSIYGTGAANTITGSDVDDNIYAYAGNDYINGHTGDDYISASTGNDTIIGGSGKDRLYGGAGNDTFRYTSAGHLVAGEVVSGGTGSDKLQLNGAGDYDFRGATLSDIEEVEFGGGDGTIARFNSSQIGSGLSVTAVIDGFANAGINDYLRVHMDTATVNLSNLVFQDWTEADDHVSIYGTSAANSITGSDVDDNIFGYLGNDTINGHTGDDYISAGDGNDTITGGAGEDTLLGHLGNDTFRYTNANHLVSGEIVNGGAGSDKLRLNTTGNYDFRVATLTSIEEVEFGGDDNTYARFNSSQIGAGLSSTAVIDGFNGAGINDYLRVHMNTASVNLSNLVFQDWVEADDQVSIYGTNADNTITGSDVDDNIYGYGGHDTINGHTGDDYISAGNGNDIIRGSAGEDRLFGSAGNDTFRYYATGEVEAGEQIDGGDDFDKIEILGAGTFDFTTAVLTSIEEIEFRNILDNVARINSSQLGGGLSASARIDSAGAAGAENELRVIVNTATTDLRDLTFQDWVAADDDVVVYGNAAANTVYGSSVGDTIFGSGGHDYLLGYNGDDYISGGSGNDTLVGGADNDTLYGGGGHDTVWSTSGTNYLAGGSGNDNMYGGSGVDTIYGGSGSDQIYGHGNDDVISGGGWVDRVYGGSGNDTIHGNYGNDLLYGENGNDTITGGYGQDTIFGGSGNDQIYGGGFADALFGNDGNDLIFGGGGNDLLAGGVGSDVIRGEGGNDTLYGNSHVDLLYGGAGSDTLHGGTGSDRLWGGDGVTDDGTQDRFVFASSFGHDQIHDFENGIDRIDFSGNATFNSFATVSANAVQSGSNVIITQNANNTLRIDDMNLADLDASDFIF